MDKMVAEKKIRTYEFTERAKLLEISAPIVVDFAKEAGVDKLLTSIQAVK